LGNKDTAELQAIAEGVGRQLQRVNARCEIFCRLFNVLRIPVNFPLFERSPENCLNGFLEQPLGQVPSLPFTAYTPL